MSLQRGLHPHPEPAWYEGYPTARIVEALERIGVDALHVGPDALGDDRPALPDDEPRERWYQRAPDDGADPDRLERLRGSWTGANTVLEQGDGPTVALRVDRDGLARAERTTRVTSRPPRSFAPATKGSCPPAAAVPTRPRSSTARAGPAYPNHRAMRTSMTGPASPQVSWTAGCPVTAMSSRWVGPMNTRQVPGGSWFQ